MHTHMTCFATGNVPATGIGIVYWSALVDCVNSWVLAIAIPDALKLVAMATGKAFFGNIGRSASVEIAKVEVK